MSTLLIDNYDSFAYNLYQLVGSMDPDVTVVRNDSVNVADVVRMDPDRVVLSPGPGRPEAAGICVELVRALRGSVPVLGVCLGHQAICVAYGAEVGYAGTLMHGKSSEIGVDPESVIFRGIGPRAVVGRYHSLAADASTLPDALRVTSVADDGEVMSVEDAEGMVYGLQFHPESILTPEGPRMVANLMGVRA